MKYMSGLTLTSESSGSVLFSEGYLRKIQPPFNSLFYLQSVTYECLRFTDLTRLNNYFDIGGDYEGRTNFLLSVLMALPSTEPTSNLGTENEEASTTCIRKAILRKILREYFKEVFPRGREISRIYQARQVLAERISFFGIYHSREPIYPEYTSPKEIKDVHLLFRPLWVKLWRAWQEDLVQHNVMGGRW